jgi:hypothetical protein
VVSFACGCQILDLFVCDLVCATIWWRSKDDNMPEARAEKSTNADEADLSVLDAETLRMGEAFFDLEDDICNLACMAKVAATLAVEMDKVDETTAFVVRNVEVMANALREKWRSNHQAATTVVRRTPTCNR